MANYDFEQFKQDILGGMSNAAEAVSSAARDTSEGVRRSKQFFDIGNEVSKLGNTSHGGNMSMSDGKSIWITRTGTRLSRLTPGDIVECGWEAGATDAGASMELVVHREVYRALARRSAAQGTIFTGGAVIHAHCLYTNYQSFLAEKIEPVDSEGKLLIDSASVLAVENDVASADVAVKLAALVENGQRIAVVRGHGPFAVGASLEEALQLISSLEYSAQLLTLLADTATS